MAAGQSEKGRCLGEEELGRLFEKWGMKPTGLNGAEKEPDWEWPSQAPSLPQSSVFLGLCSPNEEQMGSCEGLCQESPTPHGLQPWLKWWTKRQRLWEESWPSKKLFSRGDPPVLETRRAGSKTGHIWDIWTWGQRSQAPFATFVLGMGLGGGENWPLFSFLRADPALLLISTWAPYWPVRLPAPNPRGTGSKGRHWRKRERSPFLRWEQNLFRGFQPGILEPLPPFSCWSRLPLLLGQPLLLTGPQWQYSATQRLSEFKSQPLSILTLWPWART